MPFTLHRQLAEHYAGDAGLTEVRVARFVVDAVADGRFVEVQLGQFRRVRRKLERLSEIGSVVLVFPVAYEKTVVKLSPGTSKESRRRSPKHGSPAAIIPELPYIHHLVPLDSFALHLVLTRENEYRRDRPRARWGVRYEVIDRELLGILGTLRLETPSDFLQLLPRRMKEPFTTKSLARRMDLPRSVAQVLALSLRKMGALQVVGRTAEGIQYVHA